MTESRWYLGSGLTAKDSSGLFFFFPDVVRSFQLVFFFFFVIET